MPQGPFGLLALITCRQLCISEFDRLRAIHVGAEFLLRIGSMAAAQCCGPEQPFVALAEENDLAER